MISWRTCTVHKEDVIFPRLLYCESRCSQVCCRRFQVLRDLSSVPWGLSSGASRCSQACCRCSEACRQELPGDPRLVVGAPRLLAGAPRCSQVHLMATTLVHATLGFDHSGILVRQLSNTRRGSQRHTYILLMWEGFQEVESWDKMRENKQSNWICGCT